MRYFLLLLLLVIFCPLIAQTNYQKGFVITPGGDTLKGFIDYREWNKNPEKISLKTFPENDQVRLLTPDSVSSFTIEGMEYYLSYKGPVSMDYVNLPRISEQIDSSKAEKSVFLKGLSLGPNAWLYVYTDNIKERFFIQEKEKKIQELYYKVHYVASPQGDLRYLNIYKKDLMILAMRYSKDFNKMKVDIQTSKYLRSDIVSIVNKINGLTKKDLREKSKLFSEFDLFAGLALNRSYLSYDKIDFPSENQKKSVSYQPKITIGADIFVHPKVKRIIIRNEIGFTRVKAQIVSERPSGTYSRAEYLYRMDQFTFSYMPQLKINFYNKELLKVYFATGATLNYSFYNENYFEKISGYNLGELKGVINPPKFWINIPFHIGAAIRKKIEVYGIYYLPYQLNESPYLLSINQIHIGANYLFK
jgi:hypothetical protein